MAHQTAVVIPARNEVRTIRQVVTGVRTIVDQVIVVDDASSDGTADVAAGAGALVVAATGRGYGSAVRSGLDAATRRGFTIVGTLDGDGVHTPAAFATLLRHHAQGDFDLTIGDRFSNSGMLATLPSAKVAANRFATELVNRTIGTTVADVASGLRVFSARAVDGVLRIRCRRGFGLAYELLAMASADGLRISSANIAVHYDARDLFCTKTSELRDLLAFCASRSSGTMLLFVKAIVRAVSRCERVAVQIGAEQIVLHPVRRGAGYIFQRQDPSFGLDGIRTLKCPQE